MKMSNLSIQVIPLLSKAPPYSLIDGAIDIIKSSGLTYQVTAMATIVEGPFDKLQQLVAAIHNHMNNQEVEEFLLDLQYHSSAHRDIYMEDKTAKHNG